MFIDFQPQKTFCSFYRLVNLFFNSEQQRDPDQNLITDWWKIKYSNQKCFPAEWKPTKKKRNRLVGIKQNKTKKLNSNSFIRFTFFLDLQIERENL